MPTGRDARATSRQAVRDLLLLTLGASLYTVASPPYEWAGAGWLALTPLFLVLQDKTPRTAFVAGFLYGVLFCAGIAYWVYFAVSAYFPFFFPLDLLFTLLSYSFFVGSYTGLAASLSCMLMRSRPIFRERSVILKSEPMACKNYLMLPIFRWAGIPTLWVSGEFARSYLFSGFSWELLGYTQYRHLTLIQIADITGVYGLSFLMALSGYVAAETLASLRLRWKEGKYIRARCKTSGAGCQTAPHPGPLLKEERESLSPCKGEGRGEGLEICSGRLPWPALGFLAVGIALALLYGTLRLRQYHDPTPPSAPAVMVALVQGNVPGAQRWRRVHYASALLKYVSVSRRGIEGVRPDLVVWPEFAVGFYLDREPLLRAQLGRLTQRVKASLLLGAPRLEESEAGKRYYNSAYLISPDGKLLDVYDKIRLVPFAEYRPLALPALLNHSPERPNEFTAGRRPTIFSLPKSDFGVMICYEATYPYLARRLVWDGAQFLVNISNDTWLVEGGEAAAGQHFSMAVFRAVENRRYLVRAATAGISGFIDPMGRPYHLSVEKEGVILGEVLPRQEITVYARYGDWFALACVGFALIALIRAGQKPVGAKQWHLVQSLWDRPRTAPHPGPLLKKERESPSP